MAHRLPPAQAHESSSQDLRELGQALVGRHQIGRQGVGAGMAVVEIVDAGTGLRTHLSARPRYPVSFWGDPPEPRFCSIQPRTVSGSLSSSLAMSSSERPSLCRRAASACRLGYALGQTGVSIRTARRLRPRPGAKCRIWCRTRGLPRIGIALTGPGRRCSHRAPTSPSGTM